MHHLSSCLTSVCILAMLPSLGCGGSDFTNATAGAGGAVAAGGGGGASGDETPPVDPTDSGTAGNVQPPPIKDGSTTPPRDSGVPVEVGLPPVTDGSTVIKVVLVIKNDADDGVWLNGSTELLHHGPDLLTLEVGDDAEAARAGLIFYPPAPPGSKIVSARLTLHRVDGDTIATDTMQVEVYDSPHVGQFDATHVHPPAAHVPEGLWPTAVTGFAVGATGSDIVSPDLSVLVQHVVDKPGWAAGATVGFVLAPDQMNGRWMMIADSSSLTGNARLELSYMAP